MQQFIYDAFIGAGYEIYALIQDDVRYPYANEIWEHLYNSGNGYPDKENWIRQNFEPEKTRWERFLKQEIEFRLLI